MPVTFSSSGKRRKNAASSPIWRRRATIIDNATGKPYLKPYEVLERDGVRIAVLGMITPAIPSWLPEKLWSGLHFEEMEPCARKWVKIIKEKENPDVIVGLFHAGKSGNVLGQVVEDASMDVAKRVSGFDVVLMGHFFSQRPQLLQVRMSRSMYISGKTQLRILTISTTYAARHAPRGPDCPHVPVHPA